MSAQSPLDVYTNVVCEKIKSLGQNAEALQRAAKEIFKSLGSGGVWHVFATGHSTIAVQEAFHRAGGLIPVNPWLEEYLMPQAGPSRNGAFEKLTGMAQVIFDFYKPNKGEVLTIISNSGINSTPVEMAEIAKRNGIFTIAITNLDHSKKNSKQSSRRKKVVRSRRCGFRHWWCSR